MLCSNTSHTWYENHINFLKVWPFLHYVSKRCVDTSMVGEYMWNKLRLSACCLAIWRWRGEQITVTVYPLSTYAASNGRRRENGGMICCDKHHSSSEFAAGFPLPQHCRIHNYKVHSLTVSNLIRETERGGSPGTRHHKVRPGKIATDISVDIS